MFGSLGKHYLNFEGMPPRSTVSNGRPPGEGLWPQVGTIPWFSSGIFSIKLTPLSQLERMAANRRRIPLQQIRRDPQQAGSATTKLGTSAGHHKVV